MGLNIGIENNKRPEPKIDNNMKGNVQCRDCDWVWLTITTDSLGIEQQIVIEPCPCCGQPHGDIINE